MANNPKRLQDPTEAAMSAIQEALNLRDDPPAPAPRASASEGVDLSAALSDPFAPPLSPGQSAERPARRRPTRSAPPIDEDLFLQDTVGREPARESFREPMGRAPTPADLEDVKPAQRAANDDRQSVGQILQSMQRRPSRAPYMAAFLLSIAWVALGVFIGIAYFGGDFRSLTAQGAHPTLFALAAGIVLPVLLFYVLAHMIRRAQELRLIARSMTEAAMRLAEPETIARESIVSVGQAIRREVAAMGDGVERALARAAELEALVHNEVAALERAYNDNELRIRGLIEDLANQRDSLVGQAEQVRNAITGVHLGLTQDIASVSEMVAASVNDAAQRVTRTLAEKGEHITLALGRAGDSMIGALGERGGDLLERLERASQETAHAIAGASDRLTASLNFKTDHITEEFAEMTTNLAQMMDGRLDEVTQGFAQKSLAIVQLMDDRSAQITEGLVDSSSRLAETIATTGDEVNSTLKSSMPDTLVPMGMRS